MTGASRNTMAAASMLLTLAGTTSWAQQRGSRLFDASAERAVGGLRAPFRVGTIGAAADAEESATADISGEGEQRILRRVPASEPWTVSLDSGAEWQGNPSLHPDGGDESFIWRGTAAIRGTKPLGTDWFLDGGLAERTYRYDSFDVLSFDRLDADMGLIWSLPASLPAPLAGWGAGASLTWFRMNAAARWNDDVFTNTGLLVRATRPLQLGRHHAASVSLAAEWSLHADVAPDQRDEYSLTAGWQAQWAPKVESVVFCRAAFYDYEVHDDWLLMAGLTVEYLLAPWCRLGLTASVATSESDAPAFDYINATGGLSLRLSFRY